MAKTLIDIDEDTLRAAQEILGTLTKKDTINRALAQVVTDATRARAVQEEIERGASGVYQRLLDPEIMAGLRR